jgi:hypothetical protein
MTHQELRACDSGHSGLYPIGDLWFIPPDLYYCDQCYERIDQDWHIDERRPRSDDGPTPPL